MIEIKIPIKLKSMANLPMHYMKKSSINKNIKTAVAFSLRNVINSCPTPVKITLTRVSPRKLDYDNLVYAFKPVRDIISKLYFPDLQIGKADGFDCFEWIYNQDKGVPKQYEIRIKIEKNE